MRTRGGNCLTGLLGARTFPPLAVDYGGRSMKLNRPFAAGLALTLAVSACGATKTGTATSKPHGGGAGAASGPVVKVVDILDESRAENILLPQAHDGVNARMDRINADGGLGQAHARVELEFCITDLDPNKTLACARNAIADKSVIAVAGSFSTAGETAQLFATAGLPNVPAAGFLPDTFTASSTFNVNSGVLFLAGVGSLACMDGHSNLKELRNGAAASAQASALVSGALKSYGCSGLKQSIDVPLTATDVSSEVTAAVSGSDGVTLDLVPSLNQQVFRARQQLGIKVPFFGTTASFTSQTLGSLGSAANGAQVVGWYPTSDVSSPGNTAFLDDLKAIDKSSSASDIARASWVAMDLTAAAAKNLKTPTRSALLDALRGVSSYDAGGMLPNLDFSKPGPDASFPRIVDLTVAPALVQNGQLLANPAHRGFLPIFKG